MDYLSATAAATAWSEVQQGAGEIIAPLPALRGLHFRHNARSLTIFTADKWTARISMRAFAPLVSKDAGDAALVRTIAAGTGFAGAFRCVRDTFTDFAVLAGGRAAMYGACGMLAGRAFALFGPSTVGKTTLLLHLAARGARFLGDETLFLHPSSGEISAFPRLPSLREPALHMLPGMLADSVRRSPYYVRLERGRLWYAISHEYLLGIAPDAAPYPLREMFFIAEKGDRPQITPLTLDQTLTAALARFYERPHTLSAIAEVRRALRDVRGYRVVLGSAHESASALLDRLCA